MQLIKTKSLKSHNDHVQGFPGYHCVSVMLEILSSKKTSKASFRLILYFKSCSDCKMVKGEINQKVVYKA